MKEGEEKMKEEEEKMKKEDRGGRQPPLLDKKQKRPDLSYPSPPPPDTGHQEALRLHWVPGTHGRGGGGGGLFRIGKHPPFVTKLIIFNLLPHNHNFQSDN